MRLLAIWSVCNDILVSALMKAINLPIGADLLCECVCIGIIGRLHYKGHEQRGLAAACSQDRMSGPDAKHLSKDNVDVLGSSNSVDLGELHYEGCEQQGLVAACSQDWARGPDAKHLSEDNVDTLLDQNRFPNNTDYDRGGRSHGLICMYKLAH